MQTCLVHENNEKKARNQKFVQKHAESNWQKVRNHRLFGIMKKRNIRYL